MKFNVSNILPTIQLTTIHQHHETLPHGEELELKERNIQLFPRLKLKTFFNNLKTASPFVNIYRKKHANT